MGTASAKEIAMGVRKAVIDAQNNMISIPLTRGFSFPHKQNGIAGGAKVMLRPASEGTGQHSLPLLWAIHSNHAIIKGGLEKFVRSGQVKVKFQKRTFLSAAASHDVSLGYIHQLFQKRHFMTCKKKLVQPLAFSMPGQ